MDKTANTIEVQERVKKGQAKQPLLPRVRDLRLYVNNINDLDINTSANLDFVVFELEVVQSFLGNGRTVLVQVLDECNVLLCGDVPHFVKVRVSGQDISFQTIRAHHDEDSLVEERYELVFCDRERKILQEEDLVGREIFVGHLDRRPFRCRSRSSTVD